MLDIKSAQDEAEKEIREEKAKKAKERIKAKLRQIEDAKTVLANLEREKADLLAQIADGN